MLFIFSLSLQCSPYSLVPIRLNNTSCMSKSTKYELRGALTDQWTGLYLCSTSLLTAQRYLPLELAEYRLSKITKQNCSMKLLWTLSSPCLFQDVVKELFSQFGKVHSVELRDHPGSSQESGPKLSPFFEPLPKQVTGLCCNSEQHCFPYTYIGVVRFFKLFPCFSVGF